MSHSATAVPEELMTQLHQATQEFQHARREVEKWMNASEFRHQERINQAEAELRRAERHLVEIEQRIHELLATGESHA